MTINPYIALYRSPIIRDEVAAALVGVGERQLRNLIAAGKLARAGASKFHRVTSESLLEYFGLPENEPDDFTPWADLIANYELWKRTEENGSKRQLAPKSAVVTIPA